MPHVVQGNQLMLNNRAVNKSISVSTFWDDVFIHLVLNKI